MTLSKDETYYLRFANLMFKWAPQAVRVLFDKEHPPTQLGGDIQNAKRQLKGLKTRHVLNKTQWELLYGTNSPVNSFDFDVTLMICLLRNIDQIPAPITGFDSLPNARDVSCGADLARIKYYRNIVAHPNNGTLSAADFQSFWADVEGAIGRLAAGTTWLTDIKDLKVSKLDHSDREILLELQALRLEYASKIPKHEKDKVVKIIKAWTYEDVLYCETAATRSAIAATKGSNCLLVIGNPGTGKSALVQHVALQYEAQGYSVLPVSKPSHIVKYYDHTAIQVFVMHDPFGEREIDMNTIKKWKKIAKELESCFRKTENGQNMNCRLLISCSSLISKTEVFRKEIPLSYFNFVDLNDVKHRLSVDERRCILQSYIGHSVEVSLPVLEIHDNFPFICETYSSDQNFKSSPETYLQYPLKAYSPELDDMKMYSPHRYCALASFVFFKHLSSEKIKKDMTFNSIMKQVFAALKPMQEYSNILLLRAFEDMTGVYIHHINEQYRIAHTILLDIIVCIISQDLIECVLEYAQYSFIKTRVRPIEKLLTDNKEDNYYIFLTAQYRSLFMNRMYKEIVDGNFQGVFKNQCMQKKSLQSNLFQLMRDEQTLDMVLPVNGQTYLKWGLWHPYFSDLKEHILTSGATPILHWAIAYGWMHFFNLYLEDSDTCKKVEICTLHRETVLVLALFSQDLEAIDCMNNRIHDNILKESFCTYCKHSSYPIAVMKHRENCCMNFPHLFIPVRLQDEELFKFMFSNKIKLNPLCDEQAMINGTDPFGNTCLMLASYLGNFTIVSILLQKKADVNAMNAREETSLILACYQGHSSVVDLLIEYKANLDTQDTFKRSALFYACRHGYESIVKVLLKCGALTDAHDFNYVTPLLEAYRCERLSVIKLLLASKADIQVGPASSLDLSNNNMCLRQNETLLAYACAHGKTMLVNELLHICDPNESDTDGNTPLIRACQGIHKSIVEMLIQYGAHVHAQTAQAMTALMFVCQNGNTSIANMLLHHRANVNHRNIYGETCLLLASKNNHEPIVHLLLQYGCVVNTPDCFDQTPLFHACQNRSVSKNNNVKLLIDHGADCNCHDNTGVTPLMKACYNSDVQAVKQLLQGGAKVNTQEFIDGRTSLMKACQIGHAEIVSLLLQYNADVNIRTKSEVYQSALTIVCEYGRKGICSMVLDKGDVTRQNLDSSFLKASEYGHILIVKQMIEKKADVNTVGSSGTTPLMAALKLKHSEIAYFILTKGGCMNQNGFRKMINQQNSEGMSMLHFACMSGDKKTAEDLINKGANVNLCNMFQSSCLLEATKFGSFEVVGLLLKHSADPNLCDDFSETPVYVAIENNSFEIFTLLLDHFADVNIRDCDGTTPLMLACLKGKEIFAMKLLKARAKVDAKNKKGFTSLMNAVLMNHFEICRSLLDHGADVTAQSQNGSTALSIAKSNDHTEIIHMLSQYEV